MVDARNRIGRRIQRVARILTPFLLLLLGLGGWAWATGRAQPATDEAPEQASTSPLATAEPSAAQAQPPGGQPVIALATPYEVGTPVPTFPAAADVAAVVVQGPPDEAVFRPSAGVTFYWTWASALPEGWQFAVLLVESGATRRLGEVTEPNLGAGYRLGVGLADAAVAPGQVGWYVVLEDASSGAVITQSEPRTFRVLEG